MAHRFQQPRTSEQPQTLLQPLPTRRAAQQGGFGWVHAFDARLRRWCQGDQILLWTLRCASVPMMIGIVLVLLAIVF